MRIKLEFDSVKEMREFYDGVQFVPYGTIRKKETPAAKEQVQELKEEAPAAEEEVSIVDVRKLLRLVNKKTGENTAKNWISEEGFETLADVKDPDVLQRLSKKAEEVINAE